MTNKLIFTSAFDRQYERARAFSLAFYTSIKITISKIIFVFTKDLIKSTASINGPSLLLFSVKSILKTV